MKIISFLIPPSLTPGIFWKWYYFHSSWYIRYSKKVSALDRYWRVALYSKGFVKWNGRFEIIYKCVSSNIFTAQGGLQSITLDNCLRYLVGRSQRDQHDALADAKDCFEICEKGAQNLRYPTFVSFLEKHRHFIKTFCEIAYVGGITIGS
jgi:hypothetical protein